MTERGADAQRRRDAARARELLGAEELDALLGAHGADDAVTRLLANHPVVGDQSVSDGLDLLTAQRQQPEGVSAGRTSRWVSRVASARSRQALRWAAGRTGQLERGLPMVSPVRGADRVPRLVAIASWVLAPIALLILWIVGEDGPALLPWVAALALVAHGACWLAVARRLRRAVAVADEHLFLLRERKHGLPVDAASALTEQFLEIHAGPFRVNYVREWTAYPVTAGLPQQDVDNRLAQLRSSVARKLLDVPDTRAGDPIVHAERVERGEHTPTGGRLAGEYAGGWLVAEALAQWDNGPAWLVVRDHPERFSDEVLPWFGARHEFVEGSIRRLDQPVRVPSDTDWIDGWVKEQRSP